MLNLSLKKISTLTNILSSRQIKLNQTIYLFSKKQFNTNTCLGSMCEDEICIKNQKCKKTNKDLANSSDSDDDSLMGFGYDLNGNFGYGLKLGGFRNYTNVVDIDIGKIVEPVIKTICDPINTPTYVTTNSNISTNINTPTNTIDTSTYSFANSTNESFDNLTNSTNDIVESISEIVESISDLDDD